MKFYILLPLFIISFALNAQTKNEYKEADEKMVQFLKSFDDNKIDNIVAYINTNFFKETDKLRATYVWITNSFEYDIENMFAMKSYSDPQEIIDEMLKNKKGVCMHFAYLFNETGNQLGIKTYVIPGYTKQQGFVDDISHVWCASLLDSVWFLIDPTWGTGYILNHKFVKEQNDYYFKTAPEDLIRSHIPFDPLWQFLYYPISSQEFYDGHTIINKEKPIFNFIDTLKIYENSTRIEQLTSSNRRIEQNGVKNTLTINQLNNNAIEIEYYSNQIVVDNYNSAVYLYNEGINHLNKFIIYRNNQFTPEKTEIEIRNMIHSAESSFISSRNELQNIVATEKSTIASINQLKISINEAFTQVSEQKDFINKYFGTKKIFRKSLFYKYYWMGIPLN